MSTYILLDVVFVSNGNENRREFFNHKPHSWLIKRHSSCIRISYRKKTKRKGLFERKLRMDNEKDDIRTWKLEKKTFTITLSKRKRQYRACSVCVLNAHVEIILNTNCYVTKIFFENLWRTIDVEAPHRIDRCCIICFVRYVCLLFIIKISCGGGIQR